MAPRVFYRCLRFGFCFSLLMTIISLVYNHKCSLATIHNRAAEVPDFHHRYSDITTLPAISRSTNITESFVISFDPDKVNGFIERNRDAGLDNVLWAPAADGKNQRNLDLWAQISGQYPPLNASAFTDKDKGAYASPHAVGCYLAHWNLLRSLAHRPAQLRPEASLFFEDDAGCAPRLVEHVLETIRQLPENWDILFVGGKPFSYFKRATGAFNSMPWTTTKDSNSSTLRRDICRGDFGRALGPLAPDGSRVLSEDGQPYWQTKYSTNTDAYVINPRRLHLLLENINPHKHAPIDIVLGDLMSDNKIQAFMTTRMWCRQGTKDQLLLDAPISWAGYFGFLEPSLQLHPALNGRSYVWQDVMLLENCTF